MCLNDLVIEDIFMIVQEGWSLAECFSIRCVVAAPYVVPYRYLRSLYPFLLSTIVGLGYNYTCFVVRGDTFTRSSTLISFS